MIKTAYVLINVFLESLLVNFILTTIILNKI